MTIFVKDHQSTLKAIEDNDPPVEVNQRWVIRNDSKELMRKIRILAHHPDGGFIFIDLHGGKLNIDTSYMKTTPEYNLRRIFELEQ